MKTFNDKGFSSIAAVAVMLLLSFFGFAVVGLVTTSQSTQGEQLFYDRAFYVAQAGLEYGMRKIYEGVSPVVASPGVTFGDGYFTIDRSGTLVTITAHDGNSQVSHSVTSPSQADCTSFDLSSVSLDTDGKNLKHITFQKICLEQTVLDKMNVSWTNPGSEKLKKIKAENSTLYDDPSVTSGTLIELADYTVSGNGNNNINHFEFTDDMSGKTFTISFIMGDGSAESYTFTP